MGVFVVARQSPGVDSAQIREFGRIAGEQGLKAALHWRDAKFGDGRARVEGPEIRDENGRLV